VKSKIGDFNNWKSAYESLLFWGNVWFSFEKIAFFLYGPMALGYWFSMQ
jgi:hypothetical protein